MPTPSDQRRIVHVRRRFADPKGIDAMAYRCIGWWRRVPWRVRGMAACAARIDKARDKYSELDDGALNARLIGLRRRRLAHPEDVEGNLEEGLALLAVAAHRQLGLAPYRVQLMASVALVRGFLTEVDTGEGKTLALALAAAFQAWSGRPCHVITANDYLAERDARQLKTFYEKVGLTVGSVLGETQGPDRREGYACSVTYTTAKEVAADYLRDRLNLGGLEASGNRLALARLSGARGLEGFEPVQRGLFFALIDEADNALIDEAVTPLIISRGVEVGELAPACSAIWKVAETLQPGVDYRVNHTLKSIEAPEGHLEELASRAGFSGSRLWASNRRRAELLRLALEAREFFRRDEQYVINDDKVVIVDEATGRQMPMRTWRQGLHQMIEVKEGVPLSGASETIARVSFQSFFRKYQDLAGASGTVREVASEIWRTYGLPVVRIPRNLPNLRQFLGVRFHATMEAKAQAIAAEVKVRHARGQPVLLGMRSVEASESIAERLAGERLSCHVLNARRHREEAGLVMRAGHLHRITIATNMAGRGTDIKLDPKVEILGGLHVIASEPHESARVDRQLFGRAARHGDPGSVLALYSAEDPLFVRFVAERIRKAWARALRHPPGNPLNWMGQLLGKALLFWSQYRSQTDAVRRRRGVMKTETELIGNLGFSRGVARNVVRS